MPLEDYSIEELYTELQKRAPQPLNNPNWAELIKKCEEVITFYAGDLLIESSEFDTDLAEKTLEVIYGPAILIWFRQRDLWYYNISRGPKP